MIERQIPKFGFGGLCKNAALLILLLIGFPEYVLASNKLALIIGNGDYDNSPLTNPVNDARDLAATLKDLGFDVIHKENIGYEEMEMSVTEFTESLESDSVGLFYYAGHGVQIKGHNYLLPIGNGIRSESDIKYKSMNVGYVLDSMELASNLINIVIIDACRNNPFEGSFRSLSRGLAKVDGPIGSIIAYATAPGEVAADGNGRNGVYTSHLLKAIRTPGLDIEGVFKKVRNGVIKETNSLQIPWEESSLTQDFYFTQPDATKTSNGGELTETLQSSIQPSITMTEEQRVWLGINQSDRASDFRQFLRQFPSGDFASYAKSRLASIEELSNSSNSKSAKPSSNGKPVIAIADIALSHPSARLVFSNNVVRSQITQGLYDLGGYKIIDDSEFEDALYESDLEWADLVEDQGHRESVQSILYNDYFLVADITSYSENVSYTSSAFKKTRTQTTSIRLSIQLRDSLTNEVIQSVTGKATREQETTKTVVGLGPAKGTNQELAAEVLDEALKEALQKLKVVSTI